MFGHGYRFNEENLVMQETLQLQNRFATTDATADVIPCPYVYAGGRCCKGHVIGINAFKAVGPAKATARGGSAPGRRDRTTI
jgi:hypothetical protein